MRIGLVTGEYPPDQGGVGDFTHRLGEALAALGHEVHVLTDIRNTQYAISFPLTVHRVVPGWGWGCWQRLLALARELSLDVLNVQYQAAAYGMHPAINFVPR
ncbi:MAG TPA: glycosyl transferase family 1, partial [Chloroflexi bacterium]|nr:glycosyl transferase family 1 [Chloroflexota bacterium]